MAAPSTRTLMPHQVTAMRAHRRAFGGNVAFGERTTLFCRMNEHGLAEISASVCGVNDSFDPEMGELLARERWSDGYFITIDEECADYMLSTLV